MIGGAASVMFSKGKDDWETPRTLFDILDAEFNFTVDMAADLSNRLCPAYWGPDHRDPARRNSLVFNWDGTCWLNPPYSQGRPFVAKAAEQRLRGITTVVLMPARTDTRWWHESVWDGSTHRPRTGVEVRFIKGRLRFGGATAGAPFPSVIIIFHGGSL